MSVVRNHTWQSYCHSDTARQAQDIVRAITEHLRDEAIVRAASELAIQQSHYPELLQVPMNMAAGFPGLALLSSYLDICFPGEEWDVVGHHYLQLAIGDMEGRAAGHPSLFQGLSGIAFATWSLSRNGKRYPRLLASLEQQLWPAITRYVTEVLENQIHGCVEPAYDLISGPSGMGAYLLCRREYPEALKTLQTLLRGLVYLAEERDGIPHWYIPAHMTPKKRLPKNNEQEYVNLGLAHGIPGPLAVMALAKSYGIEVPGMDEALIRVANWLVDNHIEDEWGINWPFVCSVEDSENYPSASRAAWCYGSPGVARSLWLAGKALPQTVYQNIALAAMQAIFRRPISVRDINSPCFCHGVSGLLQITLRFAHDTGNPLFFEEANTLCEQLLGLYQPDSLLGYRHEESAGVFVDSPWLLDGAAGVVLTLLAASTSSEPSWDRLFLLA